MEARPSWFWAAVLLAAGTLPVGCAGDARQAPEEPGAAAPLRIMPLGDSITQGTAGRDSYRRMLWHKLRADGMRVDFVGSLRKNFGGPPANDDYDLDHEGHWGWHADQVLEELDGWLKRATPDLVLLHLGTNDLGRGQDPAGVIAELKEIVALLRKHNPDVKILAAQLIPVAHPIATQRIKQLNSLIVEMAGELSTRRSPVQVVDQFTGFDAREDTYDGIHPNSAGEQKMARRWHEGILAVLGQYSPAGCTAPATGGNSRIGPGIARGLARAGAAVYLAPQATAFVTGQIPYVDGGWLASF